MEELWPTKFIFIWETKPKVYNGSPFYIVIVNDLYVNL